MNAQLSADDDVLFLPHRLNRQPVVVRGLTADELWVCSGLSALIGLLLSLPLAWITATPAVLPTVVVAMVAIGILLGGGALRRHKRGRPDTWLYRQLQWRLAVALARHCPWLCPDGFSQGLIIRSGYWSTRRG